MITIYYRGSCHSSQRALSWFKKYNLKVQKQLISTIDRNNLLKLLQLSDEGVEDILKRPVKSSVRVNNALKYIESLTFNQAVDYILEHACLLKTPVILEGNNLLVGYNEDEIRKFLPKEYRRHLLKNE